MIQKKYFIISGVFFLFPSLGVSSEKISLGFDAYDGGYLSAETLGRGGTGASGVSSLGAGSTMPAGLSGNTESSVYTSVLTGLSSKSPKSTISALDPTDQKLLQNLAVGSDKGILFYEPLGRQSGDEISVLNTLTANRRVDFAADAIGFAASDKWKDGSVGISMAYLYSSYTEVLTSTTAAQSDTDRGYGLRLNIALRRPTGPFMWGLQLQNVPGFLWWNHHRRDQLPVRVRIGNTWRIKPGMLFSVDTEKRYYKEGSIEKNYVYVGSESVLSDQMTFRIGVFSEDIGKPNKRHWTGGLTWKLSSNVDISYALDQYENLDEKVKQSILSIRIPLSTDSES